MRFWFLLSAGLLSLASSAQADVRLFAAGSLKGAMVEMSEEFARQSGISVQGEYGPSGLLRSRIENGEPVDIFASADMNHPRRLVSSGRAQLAVRFTGNRLCALARPEVGLTSDNVLDKALSPTLKLGTSTPVADPSGDYTWKVFDKADAIRPGAGHALKSKALQLVGGPRSESIPAGHSAVPYMFASGQADLFLAYCTTGRAAQREGVKLDVVNLPPSLAQSADYGLVVLKSDVSTLRFALFILSEQGQAILTKWGFEASSN